VKITADELNSAIRENDNKVIVTGGDKEFHVRVSEAVQDESHFTVPGVSGTFRCIEVGRDVDEPGTYNYVYQCGNQTFAVFGSYDSWNGTDIWDEDFSEVEEKIVAHSVWRVKE